MDGFRNLFVILVLVLYNILSMNVNLVLYIDKMVDISFFLQEKDLSYMRDLWWNIRGILKDEGHVTHTGEFELG